MHGRKISVVGLGYVGLPVAVAFGKRANVIGFDINARRIFELRSAFDRTNEVSPEELKAASIHCTTHEKDLLNADFHIVTVPTPIDKARKPDLSPVIKASEIIGRNLRKGSIVVYESTVYPGVTENLCVPILEENSRLKCGNDFTVGYSPERINPGDREHTFIKIRKVVSGQDPETLEIIAKVYESVVAAGVYRASSIKIAESAKIIENIQRDVNIALMNELAILFNKMKIDTAEVLAAAATKWNFVPFSPGLVGGHCIGVDPYYLTHLATTVGYSTEVILSGRRINDGMGEYVASQVVKGLTKQRVDVKGATVTVLGLTFKENITDIRNTKVVDIINELRAYGLNVQVHDPYAIAEEAIREYGIELVHEEKLLPADAMILAVPHKEYVERGWAMIQKKLKSGNTVVFDVKSKLDRKTPTEHIRLIRL
jgi:UDP-N-acetyl-D-galactosamine dehydrogenase